MNDYSVAKSWATEGSEALPELSQMLMASSYTEQDLLRVLFRALDEHEVRYCVLHSWNSLPDGLHDDLDLAVLPIDRPKLRAVFGALQERGFWPVQCLNCAVNAYTFVFFWFNGLVPMTTAVGIAFECRQSGVILASAERFVAGRRRYGLTWISEPEGALYYLLSMGTLKANIGQYQQQQLKDLVDELGRSQAEEIASELYGEEWKNRVVDACLDGTLPQILKQLAAPLRRKFILCKPFSRIRYAVENSFRLIKRHFQPTGVVAVVLGPDGVGKSTLVRQLLQAFGPAFARHRVFHFRPHVIAPRRETGLPCTEPHADPVRGTSGSVVRLFGFFVDYWVGYLLVIRPVLNRSGLVIFDRYFHDITIDNKRYRYAGPSWLPRMLSHIVPPADLLFLVLDADVDVILSRKREVEPEELKGLRASYLNLISDASNAGLVKTDEGIEQSAAVAARLVAYYMANRFRKRHGSWIKYTRTTRDGEAVEITQR